MCQIIFNSVSPSTPSSPNQSLASTRHFIMYPGITKIYYRKTAGHVFTKPVQTEETTQNVFPSKLFSIVVHISAARRCECYVVRKWPLRGRSRFVCWNITWVSLWLLYNVHFVQTIRPTIATWPRWPCTSEEYRCTHVEVYTCVCVARTWISYRYVPCHPWCTHRTSLVVKKKLFRLSCGCEQSH